MDLISVDEAKSVRIWTWANGYRPVPISNPSASDGTAGKRPVGAGWQIAARSSPPRCVSAPVDPLATNTGILTDGLRAIDIDIDDDAKASEIEALAREVLGQAPVRGRPNSGKRLLVYRAADGEPVKRAISGTDGKIEVLGRGQQFVAFGVHPSGVCYEWRGDLPALKSLVAISEDEVTAFLDMARGMIGAAPQEEPARPMVERGPAPENIGARERAAFETALDAECQSVRTAPPGTRNDTLNRAAFNVGTAVGAGWGTRGEAEAALTDAGLACGLTPTEVRKTVRSGLDNGIANPRGALANRDGDGTIMDMTPLLRGKTVEVIDGTIFDPETGEVLGGDSDDAAREEVPAIDEALTHVDGVLGMVTDWIVQTSRRPNRRMALAAALPLVGTLIGRRVAGPTLAATHLYVICTAPTGAGKQHQIDCIERIMTACNLSRHVGPSQFMSVSAAAKHISEAPLSICAQDEFGAMLKKIGSPKASGHEQMISAILRSAWGTSFGIMRTPAYASARSMEVAAPALSLFGPSTAQELFDAMRGRDILNGFINRFLVIDAGGRVDETEPSLPPRDVPAHIVKACCDLYGIGMHKTGALAGGFDKNHDANPDPIVMAWDTPHAKQAYQDLSADCYQRMDADQEAEPFMARVAELAIRCATILDTGRNHRTLRLTEKSMIWGGALAMQSATKLISDASRHMLDPLTSPEIERKIIEKLSKAPLKTMTVRALHMGLHRNFRFADDLKRSLDALHRSGIIAQEKVKISGGERVTIRLI